MGWKGESRRHSLSRKGIKTNIDDHKRLSVRNFVARGRVAKGYDIDNIYDHFIIAMLWSTTDDDGTHLDHNYSIHDVDKDTEQAIKHLIEDFIEENHELFDQIELEKDIRVSEEMIGHDLLLDTQGHGVGFWDRGYGHVGKLLSEEAKNFFNDSMYAYAGDDGKIYFEGVESKASDNKKKPHYIKEPFGLPYELTEKDKFKKPKASGGSKNKKWEVIMISPYGKTVIEEVTLGRKSNKFDVIQQLKREGISGEIVQIKVMGAN